MSMFVDVRLDARQRPLGVVVGEVAAPDLLEERDRRGSRHLLQPDLVRALGRLLRGRAEHDRGRREDQQLVGRATVGGQSALHVGEERLARLERRVRREDDVGGGGREVATVRRVAGLEQHRVTLRSARRRELAAHLEVRAVVADVAHRARPHELPGARVRDHGVVVPRVPQRPGDLDQLGGPLVALLVRQEAAAAEVLPGERVRAGHQVPRGAPAGQDVERRELAGQLPRLVERRVDRARQPDPVGDRGQRREHGQRVRAGPRRRGRGSAPCARAGAGPRRGRRSRTGRPRRGGRGARTTRSRSGCRSGGRSRRWCC